MGNRIFADMLVVIHFLWILFMLIGFFITLWECVRVYCFRQLPRFFDRWIFRTIHLGGILFVAGVAALGKYCPLTVWEFNLRSHDCPNLVYPGSFMVRYIERFIYPSVHPLAILIPTVFVAVFTLAVFVVRPPEKIKCFLHLLLSSMSRRR